MIKNWRITSDITLMIENIDGTNIVYIASPEKKQYEAAVSRLSKNIYKTITIENKDFEIKLENNKSEYLDPYPPNVLIKTPRLPELGWAKVANFYVPSVWNIISQCKVDCGKIIGKFNVSFTDSDPKIVSFISPDMIEYQDEVEEMKRRLRCEFGKKTKSLKPGHRYDLPKETRYFICPVVYRKSCLGSSDFLGDYETLSNKAYIYTNRIKPGDTKISEVLKNNVFGTGPYDLKVTILDGSSWIDSGEKLEDDFSGNIKDYWESSIDNSMNKYKKKIEDSEYYTYSKNIKEIFDILGCQSPTDLSYKVEKSLLDKIVSVVSEKLRYDLLKVWKLRNKDKNLEINDTKKLESNVEGLCNVFYKTIVDENIEKCTYYKNLLLALGIDLQLMATEEILTFSESDLNSSFEEYLKNKFFWENKKFLYSKPVLDFYVNRFGETPDEVKNLFIGSELAQTICDLFNYSNSNYGIGVSEYKVISRKNEKDQDVGCKITLQDIINFKKGVSGMSENLKNEIKDNKFSTIMINCKKTDIL